ncbi:hypothetical protein E2C01_102639 [Portunus trituberculatus]|uniref:Uncharacterized protein n=1 Tax=Portunus trituberculatus TaxID=210409 RepID=A0A5B7KD51_PORTR|nr:hypothetical protein [Portunus trituberculatus]
MRTLNPHYLSFPVSEASPDPHETTVPDINSLACWIT